ncbi:MAG: hypothetical protein IPN07_07105 [Dehalococcoidia bacterium]|nr:hypothetical protein [Dehalococcoidia bacterium]
MTFGSSIEEDLARRDFAINAFRRTRSRTKLDLYGGEADPARRESSGPWANRAAVQEEPASHPARRPFRDQLGFAIRPARWRGWKRPRG